MDCGLLPNPFGGQVIQDGTTFGLQANYFCGEQFILVGDTTRICQSNGQWSGSEPSCAGRGGVSAIA